MKDPFLFSSKGFEPTPYLLAWISVLFGSLLHTKCMRS